MDEAKSRYETEAIENSGRIPFDQKSRFEFSEIYGDEWNSIFRNSRKKDELSRYTQILEYSSIRIFLPFSFSPEIS